MASLRKHPFLLALRRRGRWLRARRNGCFRRIRYGAIDQTAPGQQRLPKVEKQTSVLLLSRNLRKYKDIYYINTNEIPGELSRENLISSHVKISPLLWLHNKSRLSHQKTIKMKWFGISLVFI